MKLYLCGPMSGYPGYNYEQFIVEEGSLIISGYEVLNPARNIPVTKEWDAYIRMSIRQVTEVDGIATLHGWEMSAGAALEVHIAHALRIPVLSVDTWILKSELGELPK